MIGAGTRRDRVQLVTRTMTRGPLGPVPSEVLGAEYWATVLELSTRALSRYQSLQLDVTHEVIFNGRPELDYATTEIRWGDKRLQPVKGPHVPGSSNNWQTNIVCRLVSRPTEGS